MKHKKTVFNIMMHIGRLLEQAISEELSHLNLHHGQGRTLIILSDHGEITQANLARGVDVKPATITNMLKPLESRGLISRKKDTKTNRAIVVGLTEEGENIADQVRKKWNNIESRLLSTLGESPDVRLFSQLEAIRDILGGKKPEFIPHNKEK